MSMNSTAKAVIAWTIKIMLPICIIAAGAAGFQYYKSSEMKMKRRPPKRQAVVVDTISLKPGSHPRRVPAMGTVVPDRQVDLKAKVGGEIVHISKDFLRGGVVKKGQVMARLDQADYEIEVKKAQSAYEKSLSDFAIEKGSQKIAREEYKLIQQVSKDEIQATDLAMRKPQLLQAKAALESATASLDKAKLNLERTQMVVPFNSLVLEKNVSMGSLVSAQASIATLVDVDAYQIEVLVPPDRLGVIQTGDKNGSRVIVTSQYSGQNWEGRVSRTTGRISDKSRMAGVLVHVDDPLGLKPGAKNSPLMLGDHVVVTILGRTLDNVYALPREYLRDGNTIWVFNNGRLDIRPVHLVWKEDGIVYVDSGIGADDALITTDLPAPVKGMALQKTAGGRP